MNIVLLENVLCLSLSPQEAGCRMVSMAATDIMVVGMEAGEEEEEEEDMVLVNMVAMATISMVGGMGATGARVEASRREEGGEVRKSSIFWSFIALCIRAQ